MNLERYEDDVRYWTQFFKDVVQGSSVSDWQPWLNTSYSNYVPGDDDIVIFSLCSPSKSRAISVQQYIELRDQPSLSLYTRIADSDSKKPIKHLVISCGRDLVTEPVIREAVRLWLLTDVKDLFCSTEPIQADEPHA